MSTALPEAPPVGGPLAERLAALRELVELGDARLDDGAVAPARRLLGKAGARLALSGDATVVALAGATGSGKSSLVNALAGQTVSAPGVRRPTTSTATAAVVGETVPDGLLDWLEVPRRHLLGPVDPALDGLVLLDLPDHDSTAVAHRLEVDRLVGLVDLLVWVLDPQKYADAAVHDRYLRPLAGHAAVMTVVLNQVDTLEPADATAALADLRRLLDAEGLGGVAVLAVSARTGEGLDALRSRLAGLVQARAAAVARLDADVDAVARPLVAAADGPAPGVAAADRERLVAALAGAAGVDTVVTAVEQSHRARAVAAAGWPPLRGLRRLRADPLRRLHLGEGPTTARTSLPPASAVQRARVDAAVRELAAHATAGLPDPWPATALAAAREDADALPGELDRVVAATDLGVARRPRWEPVAGWLQTALLAAAVLGGLWLLALAGLAWLQLPDPPLPRVGGLPVPTVLLVGGLLTGALLALLARRLAAAGARRRGREVRRRLSEGVAGVADARVVGPLRDELATYEAYRGAVTRLAAPAPRRRWSRR